MRYYKNVMLAGIFTVLLSGAAYAYTVGGFRALRPVKISLPSLPDSTQKENPFERSGLLDGRAALMTEEFGSDWTTMTPDTAGRLTLVKGSEEPSLHTYRSRLRGRKYSKGKLQLNTSQIARVTIDGEPVILKKSSDSIAQDETAEVTLNPEADREIQVDLLTFGDEKNTPDFKLEYIPDDKYEDVQFVSGADLPRRFSPLTTMTGERVRDISLSSSGKYLFVSYAETVSANERYTKGAVMETATGNIVLPDLSSNAQWVPGKDEVCFTRKGKNGYELVAIELPKLTQRKLATGLPSEDITLSPDKKYIFYYKEIEGKEDKGVMRRVMSQDDRIPGDRDRYYVMRYDINGKISVPLTYGGASTTILDFSRNGEKMLYMTVRQTPSEYPFYLSSIIEMDMNTLQSDTIIRDNGYIREAIYSPDAKQLFITGGPQTFGEIGVNAGGAEIPNAFDNQGFIYTISTGEVKAVTRDFAPSIEGYKVWNAADGNIYFLGETGFYQYIYTLNPRTGEIKKLPSEIGSVSTYSIGENNSEYIAYSGGDFTKAGEAWILNTRTGKNRQIADPMAPTLSGIEFGKTEQWQFTASDGTVIDGFMCLPPEFDPSQKYPLIVYYYGGTSPSTAVMTHLYSPQVFASRDYVVYIINPSGTTGYGQEFSSRHVNAWGKRTAEDIIEGVKEFCKEHPFIDDKKIGCLGASYGGFMTQYLQTLTDIFACAVSHAGISNVTSYWGEGFWGYSYNSVAAAKRYPWTDPDLYTKQGSLFNAEKIHTPLLLLHGKLDTNVPIGESIQIFNALRVLGRDVEFITVEDENHVISNFDRKQEWQNTIMAWFAKYLQDDPRWWDSMYGN